MQEPRYVTLPSGATLAIQIAPFAEAKALYQAVAAELKLLRLSFESVEAMLLQTVAAAVASSSIDAALSRCLTRCTYKAPADLAGLRIDENTFELVERRCDYMPALKEVLTDNLAPFVKGLFADFAKGASIAASILKSTPPTTVS